MSAVLVFGWIFIALLVIAALYGALYVLLNHTPVGDWIDAFRERWRWGKETPLPYGREGWYLVHYGFVFRDWFFGAQRSLPETPEDVPASWRECKTLGKVRYRGRKAPTSTITPFTPDQPGSGTVAPKHWPTTVTCDNLDACTTVTAQPGVTMPPGFGTSVVHASAEDIERAVAEGRISLTALGREV